MTEPLSRDASVYEVYVGGQLVETLQVQQITRTLGGHSLDTCTLRSTKAVAYQNSPLLFGDNYEVEVVDSNTELPIFWGIIGMGDVIIGPDEHQLITARLEKHHFGTPIQGMVEIDPVKGFAAENPDTDDYAFNGHPMILNPEIDDVVFYNCQEKAQEFWFLDPECMRTKASRKLQGDPDVIPWTLPRVVRMLCYINNNAGNLTSPEIDELEAVLDTSTRLLRSFQIPVGMYLPDALDYVLGPFGYTWFVKYIGKGSRKIEVRKRAVGPKVVVPLQATGSQIDASKSRAPRINLKVNQGSIINEVTAIGDLPCYEITAELFRSWDPQFDNRSPRDLSLESAVYIANPSLSRVHREWIWNEDGGYNDLRPEIKKAADIEAATGVKGVLPRRRRFHPMLTKAPDGSPYGEVSGIDVEYSVDDGATWLPVTKLRNGHVQILQHECGIRFCGQQPPPQLMYASNPSKVKLRVTASIYLDERMTYTALRTGSSPNLNPCRYLLQAHHRFKKRIRKGKFKDAPPTDSVWQDVDDTEAMKTFAKTIRNAWDMADISGTIEIDGLDYGEFNLGDVVTAIEGRNIPLHAREAGGGEDQQQGAAEGGQAEPPPNEGSFGDPTNPGTDGSSSEPDPEPPAPERFPQIVGITYDQAAQHRILHIETYRQTLQHLGL